MLKKIIILLGLIIPTITYGQLASLEDIENAEKMANYYCSTDLDGKYVAGKEACNKARLKYTYTKNANRLKDDSYEANKYKEVQDIHYNDNVKDEIGTSGVVSNLDENFTDNHLDITESGKEVIKKDKQIIAQREAISEIEKIQNGEGNYGSMSYEERQKLVNKQYEKIYANGGDANGLIGVDNIKEAKESLRKQELELENLKQSADEERQNFEREFDKEQEDYEKKVDKTRKRTEILLNNAKALNDLSKNKEGAAFKADVAKDNANNKERIANNKELTAKAIEKASNIAKEKNINIKNKLNEVNKKLDEAKEGGASIKEIEKLKLEKEKLKKEADKTQVELDDLNTKADKARLEADKAQTEADNAQTEANDLSKKAEEAEQSFNEAKEINTACVKDPDQCKKVYSPQQIKKIKEEKAKNAIDTAVSKVESTCKEGDTLECRAAIVEMNKAEKDKACLEPESKACADAKELVAKDEEVSKKAIAEAKVKAEEAKKAEAEKKAKEAEEAMNPGLKRIGKGDKSLMESLLSYSSDKSIIELESKDKGGFTILSSITVWFKNSLSSLIMLISIGALLYVGIRLGMARGNPEEFKKALMQMIYVIVGIFVVTLAWAAVTLVAGLNI